MATGISQDHIRNFAIIAHIDHGKSTLADRLLEITGTVQKRQMQEQILDSNPIERERGITIKLAPVRMKYRHQQIPSSEYILNLIDTPGHVDFGYEVSRSLAACEGAILVVDATQGVQAQTLANLHQARAHKLTIIPVINKIDLPNARKEATRAELAALGFSESEIIEISAKTGENIEKVLEVIVERIPPPRGIPSGPLRALVFSSQYDTHRGVVVYVRIVDGEIHQRISNKSEYTNRSKNNNSFIRTDLLFVDKLKFMASGALVTPIEVGYFSPKMIPSDALRTGEVGYIATGLKDVRMAKVGDTITTATGNSLLATSRKLITSNHLPETSSPIVPLPGYKEPKPMVFLGLFPINTNELTLAREAVEKLRLSDSAFTFRPISSLALGNGFHCGFLGLLHAEIVQERLSREFNLNMIATAPSVEYRLRRKGAYRDSPFAAHPSNMPPSSTGSPSSEFMTVLEKTRRAAPLQEFIVIQSASEFPDPTFVEEVHEPMMKVEIFTPKAYVGAVMQLAQEKRGEYIDLRYLSGSGLMEDQGQTPGPGLAQLTYLIPLADMIIDFFDRLKSVTEGYASLDYELFEWQKVDVVSVDILLNHEKVDALSFLAVREFAVHRAREIVEKLATVIPRQQFTIPVQATIGGQIIARADVKAFRKDVTQKLYGGDRTRKDKLLEAQKKGKSKMKKIGRVEIPQSAFFEVLKRT